MSHYSIKDLEKLTGVKAHTIRIWEKRYNLVEPNRTSSNIRYYTNEDLKKLLNISILNKRGYKISSLATLNSDELHEKVMHLATHDNAYETQIENLILAMIDLDESKFEKTLSNSIIEIGFEDTLIRIIHPFFNKVGILWQTGSICPAQEHFVSNLIRQKIIAAIDNLEIKHPPKAKQFILFLHENELHELGLLLHLYLIKKVGHKTIYLGQATPLKDVQAAAAIHESDYLLSSFTSPIPQMELDSYISKLSSLFLNKEIFLGGNQIIGFESQLPSNVQKLPDPEKFKQELVDMLR